MKIDLKKQLVDLEGLPATQTTVEGGYNPDGTPKKVVEKPLTFAVVIRAALNYIDREKPSTPEEAFKRGELIMKINKATHPLSTEEHNVDFTPEQITEIKALAVKAGFAPIVSFQLGEELK